MLCCECEQLFDAYLDGQLAGALRLEFDAHRLRCRHCQQSLALLETLGNVVAGDNDAPELSDNFTDRVMRDIAQPQPRLIRYNRTRQLTLAAAFALQLAAVLVCAVIWSRTPATTPTPPVIDGGANFTANPDAEKVFPLVVQAFQDLVWNYFDEGRTTTSQMVDCARYLDVQLPDEVLRDSKEPVADKSPLQVFIDVLAPQPDQASEPPPEDGLHAI